MFTSYVMLMRQQRFESFSNGQNELVNDFLSFLRGPCQIIRGIYWVTNQIIFVVRNKLYRLPHKELSLGLCIEESRHYVYLMQMLVKRDNHWNNDTIDDELDIWCKCFQVVKKFLLKLSFSNYVSFKCVFHRFILTLLFFELEDKFAASKFGVLKRRQKFNPLQKSRCFNFCSTAPFRWLI